MKFFIIIFFIFFISSCTSKKTNLEIDIEQIKKEGQVLFQSSSLLQDKNEVFSIFKIELGKTEKILQMQDWQYPHLNSSNLLKHFESDLKLKTVKKEKKNYELNKDNFFKKNILYNSEKFILVDDYANLLIFDKNFNIIKKYQIHKKSDVGNYPLKFSLVIEDSKLYISDNFGMIIAYDLSNYSLLWKNNLNVPFFSNLAIHKNSIYVTNANGKLYSFDKVTGKQNWSYESGANSLKSDQAFQLAIISNKLIFSNDLGLIYCIDLIQQLLLWNINIPFKSSKFEGDFLKLAPIVLSDNNLYAVSNFGKFFKININNGEIIYTADITSSNLPLISKFSILFIDDNGFLIIADKYTGKILFKKNILQILSVDKININNLKLNNIFLALNRIYISTTNGYFFIINSDNLNKVDYKKISDSVHSNLIIEENEIYFVNSSGNLYKIR